VFGHELGNCIVARIGADVVGHVQCEKIARFEESVQGFQANMVGIDEIRGFPISSLNSGIGLNADALGLGAHYAVFAVGLVPDWGNGNALVTGHDHRIQLGNALMCKAVADAHRVFW